MPTKLSGVGGRGLVRWLVGQQPLLFLGFVYFTKQEREEGASIQPLPQQALADVGTRVSDVYRVSRARRSAPYKRPDRIFVGSQESRDRRSGVRCFWFVDVSCWTVIRPAGARGLSGLRATSRVREVYSSALLPVPPAFRLGGIPVCQMATSPLLSFRIFLFLQDRRARSCSS